MKKSRDWMNVEGVGMYTLDALIEQKEHMAKHPRRKPHKAAQDAHDLASLKHLKANYFARSHHAT
ncbi:hypothetical protein D3C85_1201310 [compost metagenome]